QRLPPSRRARRACEDGENHVRRSWVGMVATASVVMALAGCGLGGADTSAASGKVTGDIKGKVTLQTWALKPKFTDYVQGVIDGFRHKDPGTQDAVDERRGGATAHT